MVSVIHVIHLAKRFFGSLDPRPPSADDRRWVARHLNESEHTIWAAMSWADQRHSIEVARAVAVAVADLDRRPSPTTGWSAAPDDGFESTEARLQTMIAAALLHDSGKNVSGLGTMARVGATVLRPLVSPAQAQRWLEGPEPGRRLALYWRHPEAGGRALVAAGSHPVVSTWAAEHHLPPERWTIPLSMGHVLRRCDND